jgi:hypothetical protein
LRPFPNKPNPIVAVPADAAVLHISDFGAVLISRLALMAAGSGQALALLSDMDISVAEKKRLDSGLLLLLFMLIV